MIMAKRLVSLLNSSISGNLFELENKEIGDFIDKYFIGANSAPEDEIIGEEKLSAKKLTTEAMFSSRSLSPFLSESDVSVCVNCIKSEELVELHYVVGEQIVGVDEAADRTLECKLRIAEAIRDQKFVVGFRTRCFCFDKLIALIAKHLTQRSCLTNALCTGVLVVQILILSVLCSDNSGCKTRTPVHCTHVKLV